MLPDDPDSQARLFYLALLGMVVAVWVFRDYRGRMGQAAQHAVIWGLIFVGVLLAIGFKDNLRQQLFNDAPQQVGADAIALKRDRDGHFYATLTVNGEDIAFVVDTGATFVVLSRDDARRAGLDVGSLVFMAPAQTANGEVMSAPVRLESVTLGPFSDYNVRAMVNGGELDGSLLGMSYLDTYRSWKVEGDTMFLSR